MKEQPTDVVVRLCGITGEGSEEDVIRVMTTGKLRQTPSGFLLRYQAMETDDNTGAVMTQDIILSLQPGRVSMTRLGDYGATMVFVKDRRFESKYRTPYGDLDMGVYATHVQCDLSPERGKVHLKYQVDLQGSFASMNTLHLEYMAGQQEQPC